MKNSLLAFVFAIQTLLHITLYAEPLALNIQAQEIETLTYSKGLETLLGMVWKNNYSKYFSEGLPGIPTHITRILRYTESHSPVYIVVDPNELTKNPLLLQSLEYQYFSSLMIILNKFKNTLNPVNWIVDTYANNIVYQMNSALSLYIEQILSNTSKTSIELKEILSNNRNIVELATTP